MSWTDEEGCSIRSDGARAVRVGKVWYMFWPDGSPLKSRSARGAESRAFRRRRETACAEMDEQLRVRDMYDAWEAAR